MGEDSPAEKKALIDYNVGIFQAGLKKIFPKSERDAEIEMAASNANGE